MKRTLLILLALGPAVFAALALRPPDEPDGFEIFTLGGDGVSAPRALAAGDGSVWTFDDRGHLLRYDYEGRLLDDVRLIKTRRGFPNGAILEPEGTVLIADSHESRLLRVRPDGEKLDAFGGYGSEPGQFVYPQRLVRIGDRVYVTEFGYRENCRVQVFSVDGAFLFTFGEWGKEGPRFARPAGIAAAPNGRLFVADATHRILVWSPEGEPLYQFGEEGDEPGRLRYPWGVAADDEYLYVVEYGNHRLSRFRFDGSFAGCFGGPDVFRFPRDVAIADGWLFVADTGQDRVVRLALSEIPWRSAP